MPRKSKSRSPLKDPPLRQAGQSSDQRLQDLGDGLLPWLLIPTVLGFMAALDWYRLGRDADPTPWAFAFTAVISAAVSAFMIRRTFIRAMRVKLGRDGERVVGDALQELVGTGWRVFHDVPGNKFNIDHVVIGPGGIFMLETKTRSKPHSQATVVVNRHGISVAGSQPSRDALDQAIAQSRWLADQLQKSTSRSFRVRPVVLFPNWFIEQKCRVDKADPWVLEPKAFLKWAQREARALTDEEVAMASFHLSRIIKTAA
jgi:Nuclease-related domain